MKSPTVSRQRAYQIANKARGLCLLCPEVRHPKSAVYCPTHLIQARIRQRKRLGVKPWRPGGPGRPPIRGRA